MNTSKIYFLLRFALFVVLLLFIEGCSTGQGMLKFESLKYPVSMSAFLYDKHNHIVMKEKELKSLHSFVCEKTFWTIGCGLIQLSSEKTVNDSLNSIIEKYGGDGIINLSITIEQGLINKISAFFLFIPTSIPFFPGSTDITIKGEIVKLIPSGTSSYFINMGKGNFVSKAEVSHFIQRAFNDLK